MMTIFEDFIAGFAVGQVTMFVWGAWSLAVGVVSGILWVGGGQGWYQTKAWRRVGVPIAVCLPFALSGHLAGSAISFSLQFGAQSLGYGEQDTDRFDDAGITRINDPGSWLGRIFGKLTRIVWYLILAVAMIPLFF